ncbi:hypothetical protein SDC9_150774 [bioreactor metagenome]|uniref:Uncharacterized protein n=1 Tax=bioreactor metagenome TaxID=1076179 RepID=A0A645ESR0_9ZZZZ
MRTDMAHPRAAAAGNLPGDDALRIGRHLGLHFAGNVEAELFRWRRVGVVVGDAEGAAALLGRQPALLPPGDELADRLIDAFGRAAVLIHGNRRGDEIDDFDLHVSGPFRDTESITLVPRDPIRRFAECGRRFAEDIPEGAGKRFRVFKTGLQRDVDHLHLAIEGQLVAGPPQTQQENVTTDAGADKVGELPVEMEFGKVGDLAQLLQAQVFIEVGLDVIEHFAQSGRIGLRPEFTHRSSSIHGATMREVEAEILTPIALNPHRPPPCRVRLAVAVERGLVALQTFHWLIRIRPRGRPTPCWCCPKPLAGRIATKSN